MSETKPERIQNFARIETIVKRTQRLIDESVKVVASSNESVFIIREIITEQRRVLSKESKNQKE